jgi:hypothetical protein
MSSDSHGVLKSITDHRGLHKPLYTVKFDLSEVSTCHDQDTIWVTCMKSGEFTQTGAEELISTHS